MDGQPVTIGGINAIAEDGKGQPGVGTISTDGTYEILNAPIGKVKIWLIKPTGDSGNQTQGGKTAKMEVPDKKGYNMNEDAKDFAERMKSVAKLPKKYERPESSGLSATVDAQGTVQDLKLTTQ